MRGAAYDGTIDDIGEVIPGHDWDGCSSVMQLGSLAIGMWNKANNEPEQTIDMASGGGDGVVEGYGPL